MLESLVGIAPNTILLHGQSKLLVSHYHWHQPQHGIIASYTPTAFDVKDHFGVFRGVDLVESFVQATNCSCTAFLTQQKQDKNVVSLEDFIPTFISIGNVNFHSYVVEGETFICLGKIIFYKFRQMVVDGRIYKVPPNINLNIHFKNYTLEKLENYEIEDSFILVTELFGITGRAIKRK